jgi:MFS transporter, PAT family, beta-lactamase induction signal transducer AmpG
MFHTGYKLRIKSLMSNNQFSTILENLFNKRLWVVFFLGFASGLPFALTAGTLQAWYTVRGVDVAIIGFLALSWLPYCLKFLWAPLLDRYVLPFLGRRRGWILLAQLSLMVGFIAMGGIDPGLAPLRLGLLAFVVVFLSATQDIAIDAYRTEILLPDERGMGAAMAVAGYRLAIIVSGGVALILADYAGWQVTYNVMAILMGIGVLACVLGPEPPSARPPQHLRTAVIEPWKEFTSRHGALLIVLFIILYKVAEAFTSSTGSLMSTFLLRGIGFSLTTVGTVNKGVGLTATIVGVFLGGILMPRLGLYRSLLFFGMAQAVTNLLFMLLAIAGPHHGLLWLAVAGDNLAAGLATAAIVAFLMSICDHRYTATQFAIFTALAALPRIILSPVMGVVADYVSWPMFFFITFLLALPGLFVLTRLKPIIAAGEGSRLTPFAKNPTSQWAIEP